MKKYCMDRNYVVRTDKSSRTTLVYKCNNPTPCNWRIRAIVSEKTDAWKITKTSGPHTCLRVNVSQDHLNLDGLTPESVISDGAGLGSVIVTVVSKLERSWQTDTSHRTTRRGPQSKRLLEESMEIGMIRMRHSRGFYVPLKMPIQAQFV